MASCTVYLDGCRYAALLTPGDVGLELPEQDRNIVCPGQVRQDLQLQDLDVGRVAASHEELAQVRLEDLRSTLVLQ